MKLLGPKSTMSYAEEWPADS